MCSTPNDNLFRRLRRASALALLSAAAIPAVGGCQHEDKPYKPFAVRAYERLSYKRPAEPAMDPTGPEDAAMAHRQWRQQEALYANSGTVAWANRFRYNAETSQRLPPYAGIIADPFMFLAQSFWFPVTFIRAKPFTHETYRPAEFEPTFTGNPPREAPLDLSAGSEGGAVGASGGGATGMPTVSPRLPPPSLAYPAGVPSVVPNAPQPSGAPGSPRPVGPNGAGGAGGGSTGSGAGGGSSGGGAGAGGK